MRKRAMQFGVWMRKYRPIRNKIDPNASYDGTMFETYDAEREAVLAVYRTEPHRVWTLIDCDGKTLIVPGWHFVNRLGYFITEVPWVEGVQIDLAVAA